MIIVIIAKLFVIFTKILIHSKNVNINKHESNKRLVYIISNRIKHVVIKRKRVWWYFWKEFIFAQKFSIDFRAEVISPGNFK